MRAQTIGIRDVAEAAGVSTATVSRALNAPDRVSAATRALVLEAVRATGYIANPAGRNLRQRRTGSVVALVPNIANPFFSTILAGISKVLRASELNLLIADTVTAEGAGTGAIDYLDASRADGVILFDGCVPAEQIAARAGTPPIVMACEWIEGLDLPFVGIDNAGGAACATRHLADLGHRAIGHLTGPVANVLTTSRLAGYRSALAERGLECREDWILGGDYSLGSGAAAARRWLDLNERPTAMFCANDEMACGFIAALTGAGLDVPGDVSVVGFDDIELSRHFHPALTTIHQPRRRIGVAAAECLLARIGGAEDRPPVPIAEVTLVQRASSAPA